MTQLAVNSQTVDSHAGAWRSSIRRHLLVGAVAAVILTVGLGGWAATTNLAGAVIAQGSVVVDSNVKKVQHATGGTVGELRVRDGDHVKAGDILVRLDDTVTRANLAIVAKGLAATASRVRSWRSRLFSRTIPIRPTPISTQTSPISAAAAPMSGFAAESIAPPR